MDTALSTVATGEQAPDFELRDSTGQPVRLSDYRGKKAVVLVFYPFAFSGICTGELCSLRDDVERFHNDDVETLAVSTDATYQGRSPRRYAGGGATTRDPVRWASGPPITGRRLPPSAGYHHPPSTSSTRRKPSSVAPCSCAPRPCTRTGTGTSVTV